jgi:hypothetical protein
MDIQTINIQTMWPELHIELQTLCESTNFDDFMKERLATFFKNLVEEKKKKLEKSDNDEKIDNDKKKKRKVPFVLPEAKKLRRANPSLDLDGDKSRVSSDSGSNCMPDDPTGSVSTIPKVAVSESSESFRLMIRKRNTLYASLWKRALKVSCSNKETQCYLRAVAKYLVESSLMKNKKPMSDFEQMALQYLRNQPTLLELLERVIKIRWRDIARQVSKNSRRNIARHQIIMRERMLNVLNEISTKQ